MLSEVRKIGTNMFYYGLGNILNKSLGFILIPVYARHIPIEQYGILAILELIILLLLAILNFGITSGHERFFFIEKEKNEYGKFLFNNVIGLLIFSTVSLLLIAIARYQVSMFFWGNYQYSWYIFLVVLIAFAELNNVIPLQILQYEQKPVAYIITNFVRLGMSVFATIYFVVYRNMGIEGVLYGRLAGSGIIMVYQIFSVVLPRIVTSIDFTKVSQTIRYGLPFTVSLIGYLIFASSDRYMLNWLLDERQTGMYGFGFKISNIVMLMVQSIGVGYLPSMYQQEKKYDNVRFYRKMLFYYTTVMSFSVLFFLFFYKIILWPVVQNRDYWSGVTIVPVMSLAFLIMGMNYFVNVGINLKNKTRYYIIPTFISAAINIGLNFILIKRFGFLGAAYSALISQTINTIMIALISNHFMPVGFEWRKIFTVLIISVIFFLLGFILEPDSRALLAVIRIALLMLFSLILYKLNLFESIEIQRAMEGLLKLRIRIYGFLKLNH